ncbi:MAG: helix-turn-helix transcriptional regulator [Clostridiaceae bacterium]
MTEIGLKIKEIRVSKKISQRKLATLAGISNTYLSDIEVGRTNPSLKTMEKLAAALEIQIKDLF